MSEDEAGPAGETKICAPGGGAVAGPPSSAPDSAGFSVQLRALDISEAMGQGQRGEAPLLGVSPLHTYQAYFPKAPSLPSCQHSSGKGLLAE